MFLSNDNTEFLKISEESESRCAVVKTDNSNNADLGNYTKKPKKKQMRVDKTMWERYTYIQ